MRHSDGVRLVHTRKSVQRVALKGMVAVALAEMLLALVGCSHQNSASTCGWLYDVSGGGKQAKAGACSGSLGTSTSDRLRVHRGDNVIVTLPTNSSFTTEVPRPRSENPRVLGLVGSTTDKATYRAGRPGRTRLVVTTPYCGSQQTAAQAPSNWHSCPLVMVTVTR